MSGELDLSKPVTKTKDSGAKLVYSIDWAPWLGVGVTITSTWTITGPDAALTKDNETLGAGNRSTLLRLLGGTSGAIYRVTNHVVTNETPPQEDERSFDVLVQDR